MLRCTFLSGLIALFAGATFATDITTIFAASSLDGPLSDVFDPGDARIAYGASSALARQIQAGAPVDVFLSANALWANEVAQTTGGAATPFASNRLVLVGEQLDNLQALPMALGTRRLAVATTSAVPAGIYAKEALQANGLWTSLQNRLAEAPNARAALALVTRGAAPFGIVYASDALAAGLPTRHIFEASDHTAISYLAVPLNAKGDAAFAQLLTAQAQARLQDAGFGPP